MTPGSSFWRDKRVCVTGGTGFVGFKIVQQLTALGAHVRTLSLRPADTHPILEMESVEKNFGDICDAGFVREILAGCDVVFHSAGRVAAWGPALARMSEAHISGTRNVLAAAKPNARIVHTSSVVTVGASDGGLLTEDSAWTLQRLRVDYVQAKRSAEDMALTAAALGRDVVVVNPGYLIGPEDYEPSVMGRFLVRFWKGRIPFVPAGGLNLVDVRDVATGHLLAAERGHSARRYILGGENVPFSKLFRLLAAVASMRPRAIPRIPLWTEWLLAVGAELRGALYQREPYPSFHHVRLHRFAWFYDWSRARNELGYCPRPLFASLRDTFDWHNGQHPICLQGFRRYWMRPEGDDRPSILV